MRILTTLNVDAFTRMGASVVIVFNVQLEHGLNGKLKNVLILMAQNVLMLTNAMMIARRMVFVNVGQPTAVQRHNAVIVSNVQQGKWLVKMATVTIQPRSYRIVPVIPSARLHVRQVLRSTVYA
jgi:hypothetical protein